MQPHEQVIHDSRMKGRIHSFETFGTVDGPGIRFVLFMQGCALRCQFCHNPDSWDTTTGKVMTVDEVIAEIEPYIHYYKSSGGGVTVSGGEPTLQAPFVAALFRELKRRYNLHTALDSSGFCEPSHAESTHLLDVVDLVLLDLKMIDEQKHTELTTQSNERILRFAKYISDHNTKIWIRHVVIPGITNDEADIKLLGNKISHLPTVERVELLPYHSMGAYKWKQLDLDYTLENIQPPTDEQMKHVQQILSEMIEVPIR